MKRSTTISPERIDAPSEHCLICQTGEAEHIENCPKHEVGSFAHPSHPERKKLKRTIKNRTASAGIILVILMMGFLMTLSTSYIQMMRNETQGALTDLKQNRARAAALSGINFMAAQLSTDPSAAQIGNEAQRIYYLASDSDICRNYTDATYSPNASFPRATFPNVATSQWYYVSDPAPFTATEAATSSIFRLSSYYDYTNIATAYYVKSQGMWRDIATNSDQILATYQCQLISLINIDNGMITISAIRPMNYENDSDFFLCRQKY
ncbi:MAG: hypothetical protein HQM08_06500 [Candidatus Riflebacteria bacterium]|nr:hypothetical protein [Candidatus Riflebacteria bacterium]